MFVVFVLPFAASPIFSTRCLRGEGVMPSKGGDFEGGNKSPLRYSRRYFDTANPLTGRAKLRRVIQKKYYNYPTIVPMDTKFHEHILLGVLQHLLDQCCHTNYVQTLDMGYNPNSNPKIIIGKLLAKTHNF